MSEASTRGYAAVVDLTALSAVLAWMGVLIIPCHWTSIWMDREFTGWVVPIANRLIDGQRLYADGAHTPMAPLPFVVSRLLFGASGIWIQESALNFICQAVAILVLCYGFAARLPRPVAFWAALATIPVFASLPKTIAYDAMAQLLVAVATVATLRALEVRRFFDLRLLLLAATTAACILTKQNTGAGVLIGASVAILLFSPATSFRERVWQCGAYAAATTVIAIVATIAMFPFVDPQGMLIDVFLTGSEPKGGVPGLLHHLANYVAQVWAECTPWRSVFLLATIALGGVAGRTAPRDERCRGFVVAAVICSLAAVPVALWAIARRPGNYGLTLLRFSPFSPVVGFLPTDLLAAGFVIAVTIVILVAVARTEDEALRAIAISACVTTAAAVLHSLSVPELRWTYDNNPLIFVALAAIGLLVARSTGKLPTAVSTMLLLILGTALQFTMWSTTWDLMNRVASCTESWPEVPFLRGARLATRASGMRETVRRVRALAPNPSDRVLLLPDDPNVEAWFDRPRPHLSAAIVFTDQYWERYVATDYERIAATPPTVIVIGPEPFWRIFSHAWGPAAAMLTERVERELLPLRYRPPVGQKILMSTGEQTMNIYVRKDE